MSSSRLAAYRLRVDWDQDSDFTSTYDDVTNDVLLEGPGGGEGVVIGGQGRDQARALAPPQDSSLSFQLVNDDRLYSIEDASSPLAGNVRPGRDVELTATYGTDWLMDDPDVLMDDPDYLMDGTASVDIFHGTIDTLDQESALGSRTLNIATVGKLARLDQIAVETILYTNITTGAAMTHLLEAAGLVDGTDFDVSSDVFSNGRTLAYWYGDGSSARDQALTLWATEGYSAFLGETEDGVILFEGRNDRTLATRSQEVQATFADTTDDLTHIGLRVMPGLRDVINAPYCDVVIRAFQSVAAVWTYSPVITLDGSGEATVTAKPSDPFRNAVTPVVTTDFTLSAGSVTVALSRTSGAVTTISFTAGTPGATISALQLRAEAYTDTSTFRATSLLDVSASQAEFGAQQASLDIWPGLSPTDAVALCDGTILAYQELRPTIDVEVVNLDFRHLYQILTREIGDRIHLIDAYQGIDIDVTIEQRAQRITVGRLHQVRWGCEKVVEQDWGLYDVDLYDTGTFGQ